MNLESSTVTHTVSSTLYRFKLGLYNLVIYFIYSIYELWAKNGWLEKWDLKQISEQRSPWHLIV